MNTAPLDPRPMLARKESYQAFARSLMSRLFKPDGTYQPTTENDARIAYWIYPALVSSPDATEREFANVIYDAAPNWKRWDVFTTSATAAILVRERKRLRPDLVKRSEEHLARFVIRGGGRLPSSGANDYVFHGYNDNMPALSVRAMILAGDVLGRNDFTDRGMFHLEGLCAHFERRGLLSEYTSGTYTAITLTALMDVAECSTNKAAREMALACSNRILLDLFGHWHRGVGGLGGAQSRAYTADLQNWLSVTNALVWYLTGDPRCVNPIEALRNPDAFPGYIHHGRNLAFNLAQFAEVMVPTFADIAPGVRKWARAPRRYPFEMYATTDAGGSGPLGGVTEIQTRAYHQPLYALGTASDTWFDQSGQQATLHAVLATTPRPRTWRDRLTIWHKTIEGALDQGDLIHESGGPHSCPPGGKPVPVKLTETGHVLDAGKYHVLQKRGSALVLGSLGPAWLDKKIRRLKFTIGFNTVVHKPDECIAKGRWYFLRFGEVYVGVRAAGMVREKRMPARRVVKNGYLRIEVPLVAGRTVKVTQEFREWCDFGYVFEIASKAECGSFARFCRECLACSWEFYHCAYRTSRYWGRHGELQILDSVAACTVRFMAIDGVIEPRVKLAATGLDPKLTRLFPDGHRVKQRRLMYTPGFIGSPFYKFRQHRIETDRPREHAK
jgi:hypothetical protein